MNQAIDLMQLAVNRSPYRCSITETWVVVESGVCVKTYGLLLRHRDPLMAQQEGESCRVEDVSPSYEEVLALKEVIEEMDVYPVHLINVLEDHFS